MAPAERPWLRLYSETTRDRKLRREKPEVRWLWIAILCMAGASRERGTLLIGASPAQLADIADEAALPVAKVRQGLGVLEAAGLIDQVDGAWRVVKWADRQYESDKSTDRVKAFRERRRNVSGNGSVTPPESESDTEVNSSVNSCNPRAPQPVDDDDRFRADRVLEHLADTKVAAQRGVRDPARYRETVRNELEREHATRLVELCHTHPLAPLDVLAGALLGEPNSLHRYRAEEATA